MGWLDGNDEDGARQSDWTKDQNGDKPSGCPLTVLVGLAGMATIAAVTGVLAAVVDRMIG